MVPASFVAGRSANPPKIWRTHKTRKMADKYAATLLTKGTKRKDTLSDHSQNSPNLIHTMKIYDIDVQIATKNPPFAIAAGGCYSPDKYRMPLGKKLVFTSIIWYIYYVLKETCFLQKFFKEQRTRSSTG
jgi:hypothetical protein